MSITLTRYLQHIGTEEKRGVAERAFIRGSTEAEAIVRECRELSAELKAKLVLRIAETRT